MTERYQSVIHDKEKFLKNFNEKFSFISPYYTQEFYREYFEQFENVINTNNIITNYSGVLKFTGNYGIDLMSEVSRYGIAGEILGLAEDFDIIHAHDWLTYVAGVAAKKASDKPLIIQVHATEFDRSGKISIKMFTILKNSEWEMPIR